MIINQLKSPILTYEGLEAQENNGSVDETNSPNSSPKNSPKVPGSNEADTNDSPSKLEKLSVGNLKGAIKNVMDTQHRIKKPGVLKASHMMHMVKKKKKEASYAALEYARKLRQKKVAREKLRRLDNLRCLQRVVKGSLMSGTKVSYFDGDLPAEEMDKVKVYNAFNIAVANLEATLTTACYGAPSPVELLPSRATEGASKEEKNEDYNSAEKVDILGGESPYSQARSLLTEDYESDYQVEEGFDVVDLYEDEDEDDNGNMGANADATVVLPTTPIKAKSMRKHSSDLIFRNGRSAVATKNVVSPYQVNIERRFSKFLKPSRADIIRRQKHKHRRVRLDALNASNSKKKNKERKMRRGNSDASLRSTTKKSKRGALHHSKSLSGIAENTDRPAAFNITLGPIESTIFELGGGSNKT